MPNFKPFHPVTISRVMGCSLEYFFPPYSRLGNIYCNAAAEIKSVDHFIQIKDSCLSGGRNVVLLSLGWLQSQQAVVTEVTYLPFCNQKKKDFVLIFK